MASTTTTETKPTTTADQTPTMVIPEIKPGMTVRVHQRIMEKTAKGQDKERIQIFEGMVIARRHGAEVGNTMTVRKIASGVGVERIFPVNSPMISKIEVVRFAKVRRAKLLYLRSYKKKLKERG